MFRKGYDTKGESDNRLFVDGREVKSDARRKRIFEQIARDRKKRGPIATINPPKRSYPGKPTRLPRYDRMPGRGPNRGPVDPGFKFGRGM